MQTQAVIGKDFTAHIRITGRDQCLCVLQIVRFYGNLDTAAACVFQRFFTEFIDQTSAVNDGVVCCQLIQFA